MKKLFLTSAAVFLAAPAFAADLPSRAAPPPPAPSASLPSSPAMIAPLPTFSWTGFYIGVQGGYGWNTGKGVLTETTTAPATTTISRSVESNGFLGGLHVGYNFQSGAMVYGVEADAEYAALNGRLSSATSAAVNQVGVFGVDQDFRGSLRARVGVAFDGVLVYVTGGAAAGRFEATYAAAGRATNRDILIGWNAGAGLEYDLWGAWSLRAEYRYTKFGDQNVTFPGATVVANNTNTYTWKVEHSEHAVRAGLSYRFGAQPTTPRAIFARY